jgi:tetratricopeptide (TPR) repeat protein
LTYLIIGEPKKAKELLDTALKIAKETDDPELVARVYLSFANLYYITGNLDKAERYAKKALEIGKQERNELLIKAVKELLNKIKKEKSSNENKTQ